MPAVNDYTSHITIDGKDYLITLSPDGNSGNVVASVGELHAAGEAYPLKYQNITREENQNAFIKQFGRYSVYNPDSNDDWMAVNGGAWANYSPVSGFSTGGNTSYASNIDANIQNLLSNLTIAHIFNTENDFAVLTSSSSGGRLLMWGSNIAATALPLPTNVRAVYANRRAFAWIRETADSNSRWLGVAGNVNQGANIPDDIHLALVRDEPRAIYATEQAFAVLTTRGKVYAWGATNYGGTISAAVRAQLDALTIVSIVSNCYTFCAISEDGDIVTWGNASYGATLPAATLNEILNDGGALSVTATMGAFCAITRRSRKAFAWGYATQGGQLSQNAATLSAGGNIILCRASLGAFSIVTSTGLIEAWGDLYSGGTLPVGAVSGISSTLSEGDTPLAEEVTDVAMALQSFITASDGASSLAATVKGTISLFGNDTGFLLLGCNERSEIEMVCQWGGNNAELTTEKKQVLLSSVLEDVHVATNAYALRLRQGEKKGIVLTFGFNASGPGTVPKEYAVKLMQDVETVFAARRTPTANMSATNPGISAFLARKYDGSLLAWGGALPNTLFPAD